MSDKKSIDLGLTSALDELFMDDQGRKENALPKIYDIPLSEIDDFPDHPFHVRNDEDMDQLVESIQERGIITPVMLRRKEDGRFEMVSGHRRKRACELAGMETIKAEIRDLSRDDAVLLMVDSNLQRTAILPSEKAFAYKMRLDAMNRQGERTDLTYSPLGNKLEKGRASSELANQVGDSKSQIFRYIRLTELVPELLEMVDEGRIALRPAVELSYLPEDMQHDLVESIEMEQCTPTHAQAIRMRKMQQEEKLNPEVIEAIMLEEKPNQKERIILRGERFAPLFPKNLPVSKREDYVAAAMEHYARYRRREEREQER